MKQCAAIKIVALSACLMAAGCSFAKQNATQFSDHPIQTIVSFGLGGTTDVTALMPQCGKFKQVVKQHNLLEK